MARVKPDEEVKTPAVKGGGLYFGTPKSDVKFISSGCKMFDLALGGGWARGRIANIVGDSSTGKCIRNAYVISDCGYERLDDFGMREDVDYGTTKFDVNLALNSGKRVAATHFWKEKVCETFKIVTRHGYSIEGTGDHKVMVWTKDCAFEMKRLSDLRVDDVCVISKSPQNDKTLPIPVLGYQHIANKHAVSLKKIKIPYKMTEDLAELLGFYVADGCTANRGILFNNAKPWFRTRFLRNMKSVFALTPEDIRYKEENGSGTFWVNRTQLFDFFNHLFDGEIKALTARYKYIPKCIMSSPKNVQAAFLRGLIDCDSEYQPGGVIYSTASKKLAEQVHLLLLNFGIVANRQCEPGPKQYSDHMYWDVGFWGKYATLYDKVIGYNRGKLKSGEQAKSDFDIIPYLVDKLAADIADVRRRMGWSRNGKTKFGRFPTFQLVAANVNFESLNYIAKTFSKIPEWFDLTLYNFLQRCNYHFDPIKEIKINKQEVDVFDVHVPDGHLFWANGFVNHNTLLAIEASANFAIAEPKGKIRYREAESAFDNNYAAALGFPLEQVDFGEPIETIEDFFEDLQKVTEGAKGPELYVVDSLDALSDRAEMERDIDQGSYGAEKAKKLSQLFRRCVSGLAEKDITLMIISQVRENIGAMPFAKKYTRSGGKALNFYSSQVAWLSQLGKLDKTVSNVKRITGVKIKAAIEKNKVGLPYRDAEFSVIFGYGIDDWKACADFWKQVTGEIVPKTTSLEDLHRMVSDEWWAIENKFLPKESKYAKEI